MDQQVNLLSEFRISIIIKDEAKASFKKRKSLIN